MLSCVTVRAFAKCFRGEDLVLGKPVTKDKKGRYATSGRPYVLDVGSEGRIDHAVAQEPHPGPFEYELINRTI